MILKHFKRCVDVVWVGFINIQHSVVFCALFLFRLLKGYKSDKAKMYVFADLTHAKLVANIQ